MYHKNSRAADKAEDATKELIKAEEREASLSNSLAHIKTTQGIEEEIRRKFDVSREGEHLLVIIDKEVEPEVPERRGSWLQNLWRKLSQ